MDDEPKPDDTPTPEAFPARHPARCPDCGRSGATHLTLAEARNLYGYARSSCTSCLLTDAIRILHRGR